MASLRCYSASACEGWHFCAVTVCQRVRDGIFALFGTHRIYTINTVKRYALAYKMPFITSGMAVNYTGQNQGYELYMKPLYARALYDIIVRKQWKKILYVYDSLEGSKAILALQTKACTHEIVLGFRSAPYMYVHLSDLT